MPKGQQLSRLDNDIVEALEGDRQVTYFLCRMLGRGNRLDQVPLVLKRRTGAGGRTAEPRLAGPRKPSPVASAAIAPVTLQKTGLEPEGGRNKLFHGCCDGTLGSK